MLELYLELVLKNSNNRTEEAASEACIRRYSSNSGGPQTDLKENKASREIGYKTERWSQVFLQRKTAQLELFGEATRNNKHAHGQN